ncbi:hypothetical protein [Streptomyces sp. SID4982]|uniref:hypothetical protein n=1 Tax=Streptomyces sp. SID4982 TaxID=2690291 RepID=UPI00136C71E0|nr:hypothetical protein [Streptomyces sp. SID4982]MYS16862.1 hypothetical protein [Streptomyces sp. SID4982]
MRRTVRVLTTAAALACATLVIAGPAEPAEPGAPCEDPAASAPRSPGNTYDGTDPLPGAPYLSAAPTGPAWSGAEDCSGGSTGKTGQGDDQTWEGEDGQDRDTGPAKDSGDPPTLEHGVQAGAGGTFTDSVPALVAGGTLIAAAAAGAGYRLYGRRRAAGH